MVALLATGGSHQPPDPLGGGGARAAGIVIDWTDFSDLSAVCRCWRASIPTAAPT
jgi:hypothetical protein